MKSMVLGVVAASLAAASSSSAAILVADNFGTFVAGNLVGQGGWTQVGTPSTLPLQVAGGRVVIPGGQTADNQDARRAFALNVGAGESAFAGFSLAVNGAPPASQNNGNGSSYFVALQDSSTPNAFDNFRVVARAVDATSYVLGIRATGQAANPFVFGSTPLSYGVSYNILLAWDAIAGAANDALFLWVNPADVRSNASAYVSAVNAGTDPTGFTGFRISQFGNASGVTTADASIGVVSVANDYREAQQFVPAPGAAALLALGGVVAARRRRA